MRRDCITIETCPLTDPTNRAMCYEPRISIKKSLSNSII